MNQPKPKWIAMVLAWIILIGLWVAVHGCVMLPTLHHPRSSYPNHDFTKPPQEIPEQFWGTIDTQRL